jgi:radical SAM family RiPP maturation amino acid epimerase
MQIDTCSSPTVNRKLARIQELHAAGDIKLVFLNHREVACDPDYLRELAEIKRVLELWTADASFRERLKSGTEGIAQSLGLSIELEQLKYFWDPETASSLPVSEIPLPVLRYRAYVFEKVIYRNRLRENHPSMDPRLAAWRMRQIRRAENQLSPLFASGIIHAPFCIELCQGCSVGCWFCAISAPRLEDIFLRTPENAALFEGVIQTLQRFCGQATGRGFLYWATDPLDNPDYEQFMIDFHAITGTFPQTTTALALKNSKRTRALLELSKMKRGMLNRFSLLSLSQLKALHREFTPEELFYVELITQNREDLQPKAKAGRILTSKASSQGKPSPAADFGEQAVEGTIACVSGFLINLVQRTVKLISPCEANERWPLGYIVYGEGKFNTLQEFSSLVDRLVDEHMYETPRGGEYLSFFDYLKCTPVETGIRVSSRYRHQDFNQNPIFANIANVLCESPRTADDIIEQIILRSGADPVEVRHALNLLFANGVLEAFPAIASEAHRGFAVH